MTEKAKRFCLNIRMMILPAALAFLVSATAPSQLDQVVMQYNRAQREGDRPALERLLADDYILVTRNAAVKTKAQLIADLTETGLRLDSYIIEHPHRRRWRNGFLLAGEVHLNGTRAGRTFAAHIRLVDLWRLRGGRWQVVFSQVTPFPDGP